MFHFSSIEAHRHAKDIAAAVFGKYWTTAVVADREKLHLLCLYQH
jgi:hypothetical protein